MNRALQDCGWTLAFTMPKQSTMTIWGEFFSPFKGQLCYLKTIQYLAPKHNNDKLFTKIILTPPAVLYGTVFYRGKS